MVVLAKGYRVVPQSLEGGTGFRHVHLKEHRGVFKATRSSEGGDSGEAVIAKGRTLFVGNVDDQGARPCIASSVSGFPNAPVGIHYLVLLRVLVVIGWSYEGAHDSQLPLLARSMDASRAPRV